MAADYAAVREDAAAATALLRDTGRRWFGEDADCPAWGEPSGDDFLSPALIEAECMRRLLPASDFGLWFDRFLPRIAQGEPAILFRPATVSDRTDGKIAHLDGLEFPGRAASAGGGSLAAALPPGDARRAAMAETAERHLAASLDHVAQRLHGRALAGEFRRARARGLDDTPGSRLGPQNGPRRGRAVRRR